MRYIVTLVLLGCIGLGLYSCKKQTDEKAVNDPRLTNLYCNDPDAVNYNWGFPGIPDNTVCYYPADLFQGVYEVHDSVFFKETGFFVSSDTLEVTINKLDANHMGMVGFCTSGASLLMSAYISYIATLDTTLGKNDSTVINKGQGLCGLADTINGNIVTDRINDSILYMNFIVYSDSGAVTNHLATAKLKYRK